MKTLVKTAVYILISYLFLMYSPTLLDFRPNICNGTLPSFTGPFKENTILSKAEHLHEGLLVGPESIVFHEGAMYTGTAGGRIVKIKDGKITTVAQTGQLCQLPYEERLCGRPLGLRLGNDGLLYIADAYYGIYTMNITTGALSRILSSDKLVEDQKFVFLDDIDIDNEGNIYMSDASSKWDIASIYYLVAECEGKGRVLKHNMYTGKTEVLVRNLYFPNGVQLSKDKKSLLICEISTRRILRYHLEGEKKGDLSILIENLPGEPDNIRPSSRGYWVALGTSRNSSHPLILDKLGSYLITKRLLARAFHGFGSMLMTIGEIFSSPELKTFGYKFRRGDYFLNLFPHYGIIVEFDENGKILRSLHSPDGSSTFFSEVKEHEGYLYLGSFINTYLGRLKL